MYVKIFKSALKNFRFVLIIPDLAIILFAFLLGILFVRLSGVYSFLKDIDFVNITQEQLFGLIKDYSLTNYMSLLIYGALFFILNFVFGASVLAFKYKLITQVVNKKKVELLKSLKNNFDFAWRVIKYRLFLFLIGVFIVVFLILFLSVFLYFDLKILGLILVALLFFLIMFLLQLFLYFVYPVMFLENKKVIKSLKSSFCFVKKNFNYAFVIWFVSMLIVVIISTAFNFFDNLLSAEFLYFGFVFVQVIVNIFLRVYVELVKFYAYKPKRQST